MPSVLAVLFNTHDKSQIESLELLNSAQTAASLCGGLIHAVVLGHEDEWIHQLGNYGVVSTQVCSGTEALACQAGLFTSFLEKAVVESGAKVILFRDGDIGRELAARLSARIKAGLITDTVSIEKDDDELVFTRPTYGGKALAKLVCHSSQVVVTVRPHIAGLAEQQSVQNVQFTSLAASPICCQFQIVDHVESESSDQLADAKIVISGGRGLGGAKNFELLNDLASLVGGAVAASRAAVDAGWAEPAQQVGQTGKMISPDLYMAVGISGAIQHLAGINNAKCVVAINTDPEAPIFRRANLGIVADYAEVLPLLKEKIAKVLKTKTTIEFVGSGDGSDK